MLSVSRDRPIDRMTLAVLQRVDGVMREIGLNWFIAGAAARDIVLTGVFGIETGRATADVDLGVAVRDWPEFDALKGRLLAIGSFTASERVVHRLFYNVGAIGRGYPLDIIPFDGIERNGHTIAWPPEMAEVMNVTGYGEALASAVEVEIEPGFSLSVVSLPGLAMLKILAWNDRGRADPRDALDLALLLRRYAAAGNEDRLYDEENQLLESLEYDVDLAGTQLLGKDVRRICAPETIESLNAILRSPQRLDSLVLDMSRALRAAEDPVEAARVLLDQFQIGLGQVE